MGSKRKRAAKGGAKDNQPSRKRSKTGPAPGEDQAATKPQDLDLDTSPFSEKPSVEDRKREAEIYELLGSAEGSERIAAASALITGLLKSEEPGLERHLEKRLFRGLASSRNAARIGFCFVLTEIISQLFGKEALAKTKYPSLTFDRVLAILIEKTEPIGNLTGQERRDMYFGRFFGLQCFVEAKVLFGSDEYSERWPAILDKVLKLADEKGWIRSECGWLIVQALPQMGPEKAAATMQELINKKRGKTAEGVGIWLKAMDCYPDMKIPTKPWSDPIATKSLPELANVLRENAQQNDGSDHPDALQNKQSHWAAQLHFVWDLIVDRFVKQMSKGTARSVEEFKLFWSTVVDDSFFSKSATDGQKFRGFMIFQKFLGGFAAAKEEQPTQTFPVQDLFSRNLMKCLINQASQDNRYLHGAALKSLRMIQETIKMCPSFLDIVLKELFGKHGAYNFDQRTNSATVEGLLQYANPANVNMVLRVLRDPVSKVKEDGAEVELMRSVYADSLYKLCTQSKASASASTDAPADSNHEGSGVAKFAVSEMAKCAYSKTEDFSPELSEKSRQKFRGRLANAFGKLTKKREDYRYLCDAIVSVEPSAVAMSEEIDTARKSALKTLRKLLKTSSKENQKEADSSLGLALLYAVNLLQLYDGNPDALGALEDLKQCSEKMKGSDAAASVLLVEILLSLASQPSQFMRQVSQQVFGSFTGQFSEEALQRLADNLVVEENLRGQQTLFDVEDEDMEDVDESGESDDEDEMSEIGSDVEFVNLNGTEQAADGQADVEMNGDDGKEASDEGDDAEGLASLDDALAKVLNSHRLDRDQDAESSDDDVDMSDSEMMALDEKLVEIFKHRFKKNNKKKENRDAKEVLVHFKHRILDLMDIYVRREATNPLALNLLVPLLQVIRTTTAKPIASKASGIVLEFSKAFKKGKDNADRPSFDLDEHLQKLRDIHEEASKDGSHAFAKAASSASLLVASSVFATDMASISQINSIYAETAGKVKTGVAKTQQSFFTEWANWICTK